MMKLLTALFLTHTLTLLEAAPLVISSGETQTTLIELYSSEGCSSCPPADQFVSQFRNSDELWSKYIPLVFHVDYWDYIGWADVFASPAYSNRQRNHRKQGNLSSVYTPGFVVNGKEWAGFFKPWRALPEYEQTVGELTVEVDRHVVNLSFPASKNKLKYHLAIVGVGLLTEVKAGENAGHDLPHDFVVLDHQSQTGTTSATLNLPLIVGHQPEQYALVAWVTEKDSLRPIQAAGGYLPAGLIKSI